jgi:hypothetical protein
MLYFRLIGWITVDSGRRRPYRGRLSHHVAHDVKVALRSVYGQLRNIRQIVVPLLHRHPARLSDKHPPQRGTNAFNDTFFSICCLFLTPYYFQ